MLVLVPTFCKGMVLGDWVRAVLGWAGLCDSKQMLSFFRLPHAHEVMILVRMSFRD